jgi:hypothetical protein
MFTTEHLSGQGLYSFADFQQPNADGVEHQAVGQVTPLQVRANGDNGCLNVG